MSELADNYLVDLGFLLRERTEELKRIAAASPDEQRHFDLGRYRAYREVLALMIQQAEAFDLPLEAIALQGIDRDRDLGC
jgi:hypothetical protein